jgi:hypothetical protein
LSQAVNPRSGFSPAQIWQPVLPRVLYGRGELGRFLFSQRLDGARAAWRPRERPRSRARPARWSSLWSCSWCSGRGGSVPAREDGGAQLAEHRTCLRAEATNAHCHAFSSRAGYVGAVTNEPRRASATAGLDARRRRALGLLAGLRVSITPWSGRRALRLSEARR